MQLLRPQRLRRTQLIGYWMNPSLVRRKDGTARRPDERPPSKRKKRTTKKWLKKNTHTKPKDCGGPVPVTTTTTAIILLIMLFCSFPLQLSTTIMDLFFTNKTKHIIIPIIKDNSYQNIVNTSTTRTAIHFGNTQYHKTHKLNHDVQLLYT